MYDGTRAADHTGQGIDGKLRLFITKNNCQNFPNLTKLIQSLQSIEMVNKISKIIDKDLSNSYGFFPSPSHNVDTALNSFFKVYLISLLVLLEVRTKISLL